MFSYFTKFTNDKATQTSEKEKEDPVPTTAPAPVATSNKINIKKNYENNFDKYYSKRFNEEMKPYYEKPTFSLSYMMIMSAMPKVIKGKCQKEWDSNNLV